MPFLKKAMQDKLQIMLYFLVICEEETRILELLEVKFPVAQVSKSRSKLESSMQLNFFFLIPCKRGLLTTLI